MILVRFQVWVFILERWQSLDYCTSLENWQPSVMAVRGFKSHPLRFIGGIFMPYKKVPCKKCGKLIQPIYNKTNFNHSGLCRNCYNKEQNDLKIQKWLHDGDTGCGVNTTLRNCIRDYIFDEQHEKCDICGIGNEWHGKKLQFILDHIDGNASNNTRENLRLICPNCDSQLSTYKSRNKNSARTSRKQLKQV